MILIANKGFVRGSLNSRTTRPPYPKGWGTRAQRHRRARYRLSFGGARSQNAGSRHLGDELRVEIGFERLGASFRAVTGILDSAERQFRQREPMVVD
jgi:hypothetical protein